MGRNKGKKKPQSQGDQLGESSGGPPQGPEGSQPGSRPQGQSSSQGTQQAEPREARGPQGDQSRKGRKGKSHGQEEKHVQQRQDQPPRPQQQQGQQLQFDPTRMQSSQGQQQQSQPQPARQAWGQRQPTPQDAPQSFGPPGFVAQPRPTFPAPFQQGRGETHSELGRGRPGFASPPPHQQLPAQGGRGKKHPGPPQQQPGTPSPVSPHHQPPAQGGSRQKYPGPPQQQPGAPSQVPPHQQPPAQGGWGQKRPGPPQQQPGAPSQEPQHQQRPVQGGRGQRHPGQQQPVQGGRGQRQTGQPQQQPGVEPPSTSSQSVSRVEQGISGLQISSPRQSDTGDAEIVSKIKIKPGTKGRIIKVESNHLELRLGNLKVAYHYDVNIIPDKPKKFMRPVVESWRKKHFPRRYPAFDGKKNLYTSSPLTNNLNDFIQDDITILEDDGREKQFRIEIKFANEVDMTPLRDFLNSPVTPQEAIQVVDIVLRMAPVAKCLPVGRSFFMKPQRIIDLGQGMEMYNGFYQSAVRGWKPFLNVDVAHKAFPKEINVIDALYELIDTRGQDLTSLGPRDEETLRKFIKTLRISYQIPNHPETKKCYRVNGLGQTAQRAIFKHENKDVSIFDYFLRYKNYRLRFPNLPTLWVGNAQKTDKILLPLELCTICADQAVNRKMTDLQTSKMIRYAATDTATRKDKIVTSIRNANYNDNPTVQEFGFSVGSEFQKLDARVLQPPMILYDQNRTARVARGVWRNELFLKPATIENWTIMCVGRYPLKPDEYKSMTQLFGKAARDCGIKFTKGPTEPFKCLRENYRDIEQFFRNEKSKFDVIFVIVPDSGPTYSYVKKAAEIAVGCLTQCIKTFTARRKMNPQTAVNILLKVNSKLNGINHSLSPQTKPLILNRPVMIMGADVTHPGPDSRNIPSVAAVTASHDPTAFKYNICWRLQNPKMEIIEDLEEIVREQLMYFYHANKCKPEAIVFFRDGVSEGQFEQVKKTEIFAIRRACKTLQAEGYEPKITFLVVQKRHHTRLFPLDPRDSEDKNKNVPAGTCVDQQITHPFMQDFYLVSHASIQGVAKPTKYCTLWDDNDMNNDQIEELTYYLCHMFSRCNRSVSYPAPTYYAHLAAARAKVYIENENLNMDQLKEEYNKFEILNVIRKDKPMFFV